MGKPKQGTVGVDVMARLFGLTPRRIQQLVAEGILPRSERGQYALIPCVQAYVLHLRSTIEQTQRETARLDTSDGGQRLKSAQASLAELNLALRTGRVIEVEAAGREVDALLDRLRAVLLAFTSRKAHLLVGRKSIPEVSAVLDVGVQELMAALVEAGTATEEAA